MRWRRVLAVVAAGMLVLAVTAVAVGAAVSVPVVGRSMEPTLRDGDRVVVGGAARPGRFDLVVVRFDEHAPAVVKRVVALPGDTVRVGPGPQVLVRPGGTGSWQRVHNPAWQDRWARTAAVAETTVPADGLFVLGDNPDASTDSRTLGPAPLRLVSGVVGWRLYPPGGLGRVPQPASLRPAPAVG